MIKEIIRIILEIDKDDYEYINHYVGQTYIPYKCGNVTRYKLKK